MFNLYLFCPKLSKNCEFGVKMAGILASCCVHWFLACIEKRHGSRCLNRDVSSAIEPSRLYGLETSRF